MPLLLVFPSCHSSLGTCLMSPPQGEGKAGGGGGGGVGTPYNTVETQVTGTGTDRQLTQTSVKLHFSA